MSGVGIVFPIYNGFSLGVIKCDDDLDEFIYNAVDWSTIICKYQNINIR